MNIEDLKKAIGNEVIVDFLSNSYDNSKYKLNGVLEQVDEEGIKVRNGNNTIHIYFCNSDDGEAIQSISSATNKYLTYFKNPLICSMDVCLWGAYEQEFSQKFVEAIEIFLAGYGAKLYSCKNNEQSKSIK